MQENKAAVIELLRQFDPSYGSDNPIYTPEGEWSYAFESWLVSAGVVACQIPYNAVSICMPRAWICATVFAE